MLHSGYYLNKDLLVVRAYPGVSGLYEASKRNKDTGAWDTTFAITLSDDMLLGCIKDLVTAKAMAKQAWKNAQAQTH